MGKTIGVIRDGKFITFDSEPTPLASSGSGAKSSGVIDDSMAPLRHPVTGHLYESKSAYRRTNKRLGLEEVGNDLLSRERPNFKERITDERVIDAVQKAESIVSDPVKRRAHYNEMIAGYERHQRIFGRGN